MQAEVSEAQAQAVLEKAKQEGKRTETTPAMGVFTRKAGSAKYKTRLLCCENVDHADVDTASIAKPKRIPSSTTESWLIPSGQCNPPRRKENRPRERQVVLFQSDVGP